MVFVFDCRSNSDEEFEQELRILLKNLKYFYIYIDTLVSTRFDFKDFRGDACSASFMYPKTLQLDTRIDILKYSRCSLK